METENIHLLYDLEMELKKYFDIKCGIHDVEYCKLLLKEEITNRIQTGWNINALDYDQQTILGRFLEYEDYDMIKFLLENKANVNAGIDNCLIYAVENCAVPVIELLIKYGADVNNGCIHYAHGYDEFKCLLENGADPNIPDFDGDLPIDMQVDKEIIELLLQYGSKLPKIKN